MPQPGTVPPLPAGVYLQLANLSTGWAYRIAADGRYLVVRADGTQAQQAPVSRLERGRQTVSEQGLARLREAVERVGFFGLGARVQGAPVSTAPETEAVAQELAFTVRGDDGPQTVQVRGALAEPATLGPLGPLLVALDHEALGGWAGE